MRIFNLYPEQPSAKRTHAQTLLLLAALMLVPAIGFSGEEATVAIVPFNLIDSSLQGLGIEMKKADQEELGRLKRTVAQLGREIDASKLFKVVDSEAARRAARELQQQYSYLYQCNGCEMRIGKILDADYVLVGWVQKVSNLILNMNIALRKVPGDEDIVGASADMRGNTDESWSRAATFLVKERLLPDFAKVEKSDQ